MDESTLITVAFIKDIMIIVSLFILILVLIAAVIGALALIGPVKSLRRAASNLEETSGVLLSTTKEVSKSFGFFGGLNRGLERVRERFRRGE